MMYRQPHAQRSEADSYSGGTNTDIVSIGRVSHEINTLLRGFELSLRARNRSPKTIRGYLQTVDLFRDYAVRINMPTGVDRIEHAHVEAFVADQLQR